MALLKWLIKSRSEYKNTPRSLTYVEQVSKHRVKFLPFWFGPTNRISAHFFLFFLIFTHPDFSVCETGRKKRAFRELGLSGEKEACCFFEEQHFLCQMSLRHDRLSYQKNLKPNQKHTVQYNKEKGKCVCRERERGVLYIFVSGL